jgi:hypothetical protein
VSEQPPESPSEGLEIALNAASLPDALAWAHEYRGDVTLKTTRGEEYVGYVFDLSDAGVRLDPADGSPRVLIPTDELVALRFSGRDMAAGKSFDRWIDRYIRKKLAGEEASLPSELPED